MLSGNSLTLKFVEFVYFGNHIVHSFFLASIFKNIVNISGAIGDYVAFLDLVADFDKRHSLIIH